MYTRMLCIVLGVLLQATHYRMQNSGVSVVDCKGDPTKIPLRKGCKLRLVPNDEKVCEGDSLSIADMIKYMCPTTITENVKEPCKTIEQIVRNRCNETLKKIQTAGDCTRMEDIIKNNCWISLYPYCSQIEDIVMDECEVELIEIGDCDTIDNVVNNSCEVELISICNTIQEIIDDDCEVELILVDQVIKCMACSAPIRVDRKSKFAPKILCNNDKSTKTVNGQKCKKTEAGRDTCSMGGEGFSFCSTEFLFFRNGHWVDWDLCSLCTADDPENPLTAHGYRCDGECNNLWENKEMEAPRCKVKDQSHGEPRLDFCTTCVSSCADVVVDDRTGAQVHPGVYGNSTK